jgi:hypothetical protein
MPHTSPKLWVDSWHDADAYSTQCGGITREPHHESREDGTFSLTAQGGIILTGSSTKHERSV